jgi:hypothetical protein
MTLAMNCTPELVAHVRREYEDGDRPVPMLALDLGVSYRHFYKVVERYGWRMRKQRPPLDLDYLQRLAIEADNATPESARRAPASAGASAAATTAAPVGGTTAPPDAEISAAPREPDPAAIEPGSLLDRIQWAVSLELDKADEARARLGSEPRSVADAERTARTLATLERLLTRLQQLRPSARGGKGIAYDDMPADDDEFRRDLARRIDAFIAAWTDPALGEFGAAGDGDPVWP